MELTKPQIQDNTCISSRRMKTEKGLLGKYKQLKERDRDKTNVLTRPPLLI